MKAAVNPGLVAITIGFLLFLFSIELPYPLFRSLELVGNTASPLSMMFIGFILAEVPFKEVYTDVNAFLISLVRLLALPVLVFISLKSTRLFRILVTNPSFNNCHACSS